MSEIINNNEPAVAAKRYYQRATFPECYYEYYASFKIFTVKEENRIFTLCSSSSSSLGDDKCNSEGNCNKKKVGPLLRGFA